MPPDQQSESFYSQYGVFWLYNWFQAENSNMNIFFLMNGNIYNYSLASEPYSWTCLDGASTCNAFAIPPNPPSAIPPPALSATTTPEEPIFVQSYINAYNTAFNQKTSGFSGNYQQALYNYQYFNSGDINNNVAGVAFSNFYAPNQIYNPPS